MPRGRGFVTRSHLDGRRATLAAEGRMNCVGPDDSPGANEELNKSGDTEGGANMTDLRGAFKLRMTLSS